jgi:hypothetical protein
MMVSSGPALSAWESVRLRPSTWSDLRVGVSASDRERPLVAGANCTLIARRSQGCGVPPRWCREDPAACRVGSEGLKQRGRQPIRRGVRGGSPECARQFQALVALVLAVSLYRRERATLSWGFILSPSATLRVAGLAPRVKVEHPTV